ncbi:MAG: leucine-rich repeat domain-containing protein, partial [Thermoguttaceae bacterium]|nr:leucine-rich repeat domain-containing protein [Thermoguttaceae bacterium]
KITKIVDCKRSDVCLKIPSKYKGKPVVAVAGGGSCEAYSSVIIPESVHWISPGVFSDLVNCKELVVSPKHEWFESNDGVLYLRGDKRPLVACPPGKSAVEFSMPGESLKILDNSFRNCVNLGAVVLSKKIVSIQGDPFKGVADGFKVVVTTENSRDVAKRLLRPGIKIDERIKPTIQETLLFELSNPNDVRGSVSVLGFNPRWMKYIKEKYKQLFVPQELDNHSVKGIKDDAFKNCDFLESVAFKDGVKEIGARAFLGCASLENVSIPYTVSKVGADSFSDCPNLTEVKLREGLAVIESGAFSNCPELKTLEIPASVTRIGDGVCASCHRSFQIVCQKNSAAHYWARDNRIRYRLT